MPIMKLELLVKLVKLANNNPNDNEANAAARKVCKIIEENNYKFDNFSIGFNPFDEIIRSMRQQRDTQKPWVYTKPSTPEPEIKWGGFNYPDSTKEYVKYNDFIEERKKKSKRNLRCIQCTHVKETIFQGLPELFVCNDCQWKRF